MTKLHHFGWCTLWKALDLDTTRDIRATRRTAVEPVLPCFVGEIQGFHRRVTGMVRK